jgi:hypothetical protein
MTQRKTYFQSLTPEEARAIAARGGAASGPGKRKANSRRKLIAEVVRELLAAPTADGSTVLEEITKAILDRMRDTGTVRDLATVADILGEMVHKVEARQSAMPAINIELLGGDDRPELTAAEELTKSIEAKDEEGGGDE